jgi:hypothetical protein
VQELPSGATNGAVLPIWIGIKIVNWLYNRDKLKLAQPVLRHQRNRFAVISPNSLSILPDWPTPPQGFPGAAFF